uniref:Uncharacterized protein n=1 Tax=Trichuris muris TaxID=70415 RepID=A0A5S6Q4G4_TRIMR
MRLESLWRMNSWKEPQRECKPSFEPFGLCLGRHWTIEVSPWLPYSYKRVAALRHRTSETFWRFGLGLGIGKNYPCWIIDNTQTVQRYTAATFTLGLGLQRVWLRVIQPNTAFWPLPFGRRRLAAAVWPLPFGRQGHLAARGHLTARDIWLPP